jgi:glycerophosphoryl diester phosphodiesterase
MKPTIHSLMAAIAVSSFSSAAPLIIAHRGASDAAPENTVASIKEAWKEGADGTELDIYLTKDGKIVTIHDKTTKRTADVDLPVEESTLEELRKLDAGSWKDPKWKGERIATLEESLAAIPVGKTVYIEIKCGPEVLSELKKSLDASGKAKAEIFLIDFKIDTLIAAKPMFPGIRKLWLAGPKTDKKTKAKSYRDVKELVAQAKEAGLDGLDLEAGFPIDEAVVTAMKQDGMVLAVWTVDQSEVAAKWVKVGVDAVTTNKPRSIRDALASDR